MMTLCVGFYIALGLPKWLLVGKRAMVAILVSKHHFYIRNTDSSQPAAIPPPKDPTDDSSLLIFT